ncbi:MAG: holo-ACP synthase [Thaumarchaeota archaeon]|nr:holo-ACP synthase [Nitrososphaerota archaeon]
MKNLPNIGIGIDIVDVNRFKKIPYAGKTTFYKKIFTKSEIDYCLKYKDAYRHFAAKFAIKEATIKSISKKIPLSNIETLHIKQKPTVKLKKHNDYSFLVSVSHDADMAAAVVLSSPK